MSLRVLSLGFLFEFIAIGDHGDRRKESVGRWESGDHFVELRTSSFPSPSEAVSLMLLDKSEDQTDESPLRSPGLTGRSGKKREIKRLSPSEGNH